MKAIFAYNRQAAGLLLGLVLSACKHESPLQNPDTPGPLPTLSWEELSRLTPRQTVLSNLAAHLRLLHLETKRGVADGPVARLSDLGTDAARTYPNRASERADIKRLLDSLRRDSPLSDFGRRGTLYDTLPAPGPQ